jgi:hypothetical protein
MTKTNIEKKTRGIRSTLNIALDYLDFNPGHKLFPIAAGKKSPPCFEGYQTKASNNSKQLAAWDKQYHGPSWGLAPESSGVVVLDADLKTGKKGQASLDDLELMYGPLPPTSTVRTPSGGKHFRFNATAEIAHKFGINGFGEHLDSAHYTLVPGNVMADGGKYEYENDLLLANAPDWFAELPAWSKPARVESTETEAAVEWDLPHNIVDAIKIAKEWKPSIEGDGGDNNAFKLACRIRDFAISEGECLNIMSDHFMPRCSDPGEENWLEAKVASAFKSGQNQPGSGTAQADFVNDPLPPLSVDEKTASDKARMERLRRKTAQEAELERRAVEVIAREWTAQEVFEEWVWVAKQKQFILRAYPDLAFDKESFDSKFNYLTKGKSISRAMFSNRNNTVRKLDSLVYKPGLPEFCMVGPTTNLNLYKPSDIVPAEGDTTIWNEHMVYLLPNEGDRKKFLNWWAWKLQNIGKKPKHALLFQGKIPGTGKSFVSDMMERIFGKDNVSPVGPDELSGQFNEWALKSILLVIEELRALEKTQIKHKLHPIITQERIKLNDKNVKRFTLENCFGIYAMTNAAAAIQIDNGDRRYLVIETKAEPKPHDYYVRLYALLNDPKGIAAIAYELLHRDLEGYDGQGRAPGTTAKASMIEAGATDIERWMDEHAGRYPLNCTLIKLDDVIEAMPRRLESRSGLYHTIGEILERKFRGGKLGQIRIGTDRPNLWGINGGLTWAKSKIHKGKLIPEPKIAAAYAEQHKDNVTSDYAPLDDDLLS